MKTLVFVMALMVGTFASTGTVAADADVDSVRQLESEWARAIVKRDIKWFQGALADNWTIVLPEGRVSSKQEFLAALQAGQRDYSRVEVLDLKVRIYGDTAIAIGRQDVSRASKSRVFLDHERRTDVYVRINGEWKCVTTHVTTLDLMMD